MKSRYFDRRQHPLFLSFAVFVLLVFSSGVALGQKKPTALKLDADMDDEKLCSQAPLAGSRFCDLFKIYNDNIDGTRPELALYARNDMIELVRGQVDTYYKLRKDGRKTKIKWLQTVLDFLEIGGSAAIAIMNGERGKTITGVAIGLLQGTRTSVNRNFEILQTQVLINKMNANRAQILVEIYGNLDKPPRSRPAPSLAYSWYGAKNDLRRYLFAGTFNNALDTLVEQTGADVANSERQLRRVEKRKIVNEVTDATLELGLAANDILANIEEKLAGNQENKDKATAALKAILEELNKTQSFKSFFDGKSITAGSGGSAIFKAIEDLMLDKSDNDDLVQKIREIISTKGVIP